MGSADLTYYLVNFQAWLSLTKLLTKHKQLFSAKFQTLRSKYVTQCEHTFAHKPSVE